VELIKSSLGHVVKTSNLAGDKNKAIRREITGYVQKARTGNLAQGRQRS
jgi:hypothetical protein